MLEIKNYSPISKEVVLDTDKDVVLAFLEHSIFDMFHANDPHFTPPPNGCRCYWIMKRKNESEGYGLIGGKPEAGETLEETILREIEEEIGITNKESISLHTFWQLHEKDSNRNVYVVFGRTSQWYRIKNGEEGLMAAYFPEVVFDLLIKHSAFKKTSEVILSIYENERVL